MDTDIYIYIYIYILRVVNQFFGFDSVQNYPRRSLKLSRLDVELLNLDYERPILDHLYLFSEFSNQYLGLRNCQNQQVDFRQQLGSHPRCLLLFPLRTILFTDTLNYGFLSLRIFGRISFVRKLFVYGYIHFQVSGFMDNPFMDVLYESARLRELCLFLLIHLPMTTFMIPFPLPIHIPFIIEFGHQRIDHCRSLQI